jgi:predicted transcriptional regulator/precorrin-6B methylase 2
MAKKKKSLSYSKIMEIANNFRTCRVLLTAFELDIFTVLSDGKKTSKEIAEKIGADERAAGRLLNALTAMDLLKKKKNKFSNTKAADKYLVKGKPGYMGGLAHTAGLWKTWSTLTEAVKKGTSVMNRGEINERGDYWLEGFIAAMHMRGRIQAKEIASLLNFKKVNKVLDVGGGSGAYSFAFVKAKKGLKSVIYDLPKVVPLTQKYIESEGLSSSVETMTGNYLTDDLGSGYDMMFLSAVIHSNSAEENKLLFKKCAAGLNEGGKLVVLDQVMNEDRTKPFGGALFALNMLVGTANGDTYTESEIKSWMKEAGFSGFKRKDTVSGTAMIIGTKK